MPLVYGQAKVLFVVLLDNKVLNTRKLKPMLYREVREKIEFMADISQYDPEMLIWIDVMGSNRRKSEPMDIPLDPTSPYPITKKDICYTSMTTNGIQDVYITQEILTGKYFLISFFSVSSLSCCHLMDKSQIQ